MRLNRTAFLTVALLSFLIGIALARLRISTGLVWLIIACLACCVAFIAAKRLIVICIIALFVICGMWRGGRVLQQLDTYEAVFKKPIVLSAVASEDATYSKNGQLSFAANSLKLIEPTDRELIGQILVEGFGTASINKGDQVVIKGKIYPTRGGKQGVIRYAQLEKTKMQQNIIDRTRRKFVAGIYSALPDPQASFGVGLLIGQRSTLPKETSDSLKAVGLTHIVAVSGYNLTILVRAIQRLYAKRSRYQATIMALTTLLLFISMVGGSPSIMRASLVSFMSVIAWYYGRTIKPLLLIVFVAAVTGGINPLYVWSDIAWYLSFLAFFGILIVAPTIVKRFRRKPRLLVMVVIETISAQIMTLPIILYIFGETSYASLAANILVLPFVPAAMLATFSAGIVGMLVPAVAGFVALPANFILSYILGLANAMSQIPYIHIRRSISVVEMLAAYVFIVFIVTTMWRHNRYKHDTITDTKVR